MVDLPEAHIIDDSEDKNIVKVAKKVSFNPDGSANIKEVGDRAQKTPKPKVLSNSKKVEVVKSEEKPEVAKNPGAKAEVSAEMLEVLKQQLRAEAKQKADETRYKVKYQLPGWSLVFSNQLVKQGENDLLLLIGHNKDEEQIFMPDKLGAAKPTECTVVVGLECENPETFEQIICVDQLEVGDIEYLIFLSIPRLTNIIKWIMSQEQNNEEERTVEDG